MGLTGAGLCEVVRALGVRDFLVPVLKRDAEFGSDLPAESEARPALIRENPTGVRTVDVELGCELVDGSDVLSLQLPGTEIHPSTASLVPLGHGVKRARARISDVPAKTANLTRPELPPEIGARFRRERERLKLTHAAIERKTGVSRFSLGRFENGTRGMDSDSLLCALFALAEAGARLDYVILGRSSAAQVALTESSVDAVAERLAARLVGPQSKRASQR